MTSGHVIFVQFLLVCSNTEGVSTMTVVLYKGQKYSDLKKQALASGQPFEDPEFARSERSLFYTSGAGSGIEWKRPRVCSCQCINLLLSFIDCICTVAVLMFLTLIVHQLIFVCNTDVQKLQLGRII